MEHLIAAQKHYDYLISTFRSPKDLAAALSINEDYFIVNSGSGEYMEEVSRALLDRNTMNQSLDKFKKIRAAFVSIDTLKKAIDEDPALFIRNDGSGLYYDEVYAVLGRAWNVV